MGSINFNRQAMKPWLICAIVVFIALVISVAFAVSSKDPLIVDESNLPDNRISSHVLDISLGRPAAGIRLVSYKWSKATSQWIELKQTKTNDNGRVGSVHPNLDLTAGTYKIRFETGAYFVANNLTAFFPFIEVAFEVADPSQKFHIPLTLSNYGYSTYKGQ